MLWSLLLLVASACQAADGAARPPSVKAGDVELSLELVAITQVPMANAPLLAVVRVKNKLDHSVRLWTGSHAIPAIRLLVYDDQGRRLSQHTIRAFADRLSGLPTIEAGGKYTAFWILNHHHHFRAPGTYMVEAYLVDWLALALGHDNWRSPHLWPLIAKDTSPVTIQPAEPTMLEQACEFLITRANPRMRAQVPSWLQHLWQDNNIFRQLDNQSVHMLACVSHEVATAYLDQVHYKWLPAALRRLRWTGSPGALDLLRYYAGSSDAEIAAYAAQQLREAEELPVYTPTRSHN